MTIFFTTEMFIKLIGIGPKFYIRDRFNIFDGIVVLISIAELILSAQV